MDIKILECRKFAPPHPCEPYIRTAKDYEFDVELGAGRIDCIDGVEYFVKRGDVMVRKPGQKIYCSGKVDSILLTLDFSGKQNADNYSRNVDGPIQSVFENYLISSLDPIIQPISEYTFIPIYSELLNVSFSDEDAAKNLIMELLYKLNAEQYRIQYVKNRVKENVTSQVLRYLKDNLSKEITLNDLAELVHLEKNYLVRIFKSAYGQSPISALISMRMERACDLVANTDIPITEIASLCGYSSPSYFTAEYKKHYGITPLAQRKNNTNIV